MEFFKTYFLYPLTNHYADFKGKATRKQYWLFSLNCFLISVVFNILCAIAETSGATTINFALSALSITLSLALILPSLSIAARRLHDTNRSAWLLLLTAPSFIFLIESLALSFLIIASQENPSLSNLLAAFSMLLTITLIAAVVATIFLIVFLCLPSKSPTRYDDNQISENVQ